MTFNAPDKNFQNIASPAALIIDPHLFKNSLKIIQTSQLAIYIYFQNTKLYDACNPSIHNRRF